VNRFERGIIHPRAVSGVSSTEQNGSGIAHLAAGL
jgi:hypothetical protein